MKSSFERVFLLAITVRASIPILQGGGRTPPPCKKATALLTGYVVCRVNRYRRFRKTLVALPILLAGTGMSVELPHATPYGMPVEEGMINHEPVPGW